MVHRHFFVLKDKNTQENIEAVKETYIPIYDESPKQNSVPFEGIGNLLEELQDKDVLLAINSNRTTDSIKYFTDKFLKDIDFLLIEGHNENYPSKPSPIGVNRILDMANVKTDEAIYIGDSKTDIATAKKLMAEGRHSLAEISEILNFSSRYYFSKVFKKETGYAPSEYKKTLIK